MSRQQHGYYRAVIVPLIREHIGCESDAEAHRQIKGGFFGMSPEDGSEQLRLADEIKRRYSAYKRRPGYDFSRAAWEARVEVVQEILDRGL
jgi:hypothetical protein